MNLKKLTVGFLLGLIVLIAVFDAYVYIAGGTGVTISHTIYEWSHNFPAFTFAMGFVMGHLFWRKRDIKSNESQP